MKMKSLFLAVFLLFTPAVGLAQTPDSAFLQRAIGQLQAQRNNALDAQVVAESKLAALTEDLAKANAKIKELEDAKKEPDKK